ncbi:MAG: hypothetical protein Q9191_006290 [Dirinaria sp. TL-2023a]
MTDNILLSLQASPQPDPSKDSLSFLIARINEQRGSFRSVTEDVLEKEIREGEAAQSDDAEETAVEAEDAQSRREDVVAAREEILRHAQQTLSPYIRNSLSLGVLGADMVQEPPKTDAEKHNNSLVSVGLKLQSLNSTADYLLESATRLEREIEFETKYWEQLLAVKDSGWSLCRLPNEKHTLGVKYGFGEAYSDFRDRGLAALRREVDGEVRLDRGPRSSDRTLRVQVVQKGKVLDSSVLLNHAESDIEGVIEDQPIAKQILQARNSVYDEELHSELLREARTLVNQGVKCAGERIQLPYEGDKWIHIDLVDDEDQPNEEARDNSGITNAIAIALRILLSHAHRQNLHRRSQPPPPIIDTKPPRPFYAILKPIIEHMRHRANLQSVTELLVEQTSSFQKAGVPLDVDYPTSILNLPSDLSISKNSYSPASEVLLKALTTPLSSSFNLRLPSHKTSLQIALQTNLYPPSFGTLYHLTITSMPDNWLLARVPQKMELTTLPELEEHILHILTLELVSLVHESDHAWEIVTPETGSLSRTFASAEGDVSTLSLRINVQRQIISLVWRRRTDGIESSEGHGMERWEGKGMDPRPLPDLIKDLARYRPLNN